MGGRFGKYGEFKRKQQLRKGRTADQQLIRVLKKSPKVLPKPILNGPAKEKNDPVTKTRKVYFRHSGFDSCPGLNRKTGP